MKSKKNSFILILALILCFVTACKETGDIQSDNSSVQSTASGVMVVIVDDEADGHSETQSEMEDLIDEWENIAPDIEIEADDSSKDNSSLSGNNSDSTITDEPETDNSSSNITSSEKDKSDNNSSENQSSDDTSSEDDDDAEPNRPDDGYFDVAV